ncbi:iron uptake system EfeUOB component EfeO/EfeM [Chromohalobacter marismortui]|uniref:Iron uptake system EfeUOB component EfeO/EfeM n=1 Tax=Chromohalobacter marismortui TaxID=42055 RepID=A0A4R7NNA2_9GAMM|nr:MULTISPECIES: iron uptake system protein EfeO [Chromohalobacter]MCI0509468.1 cupredoxin domain-containing protein [Chromohalobacter sp.]MCI0592638.1 cupredoxin domain-containing protein [Chromohalobacter sp.]TDU22187.1 iron uptake system EfeUOB component EfeO/EfeM [Chromohalobacter marismortui]
MPLSSPPSSRLLKLGVLASAVLMLATLGLFALSLNGRDHGDDDVRLVVTAQGCEPQELSVPAGETRFNIVNDSQRAIEWEILDGVMVLEERENITPGLHQPLTATLAPGDYAMTCGLLSNPHGTLHVTANGDAPAVALSRQAFIAPLAEYKVYLVLQSRHLVDAAETLHQAIAAGELDAARIAYREARLIDQRLAMAIGLYSDLDERLNARADYFAKREQDPQFVGFHRLAHGLFETGSTDGLTPIATQLLEDTRTLGERLRHQAIPPDQLANGSARVLMAWYAHARDDKTLNAHELLDLQGLAAGAEKIVTLLTPLLERQAPNTLEALQAKLARLQQRLAETASSVPGTQASRDIDRDALLTETQVLADILASLDHTLALHG